MGETASTAPSAQRLSFGRYVLDFARGSLLRDGEELPLRPKTFAVLRHLAENSGRLISKGELFSAVWPNVAVTDDTLVQSIGELRRALGDDGARLIATVPRRGYRFDAEVSATAPAPTERPAEKIIPSPVIAAKGLTTRPLLYAALALVLLFGASVLWIALRQNGTTAAEPAQGAKPAIAILPFQHQAEDARDYFADGLTQDVINALGRFPALTVMSWNAVFPLKGKPANPDRISRSLGARYLVEGSVRQTADRLRVTAQLVDREGRVLWSGRFDEALADVFTLQDKLTTEIAGALAIRVTQNEQQRAAAKPTGSLEAYDLVLRARPALARPTRGNNAEARALLRQAIQLDPDYAAAYAALGDSFYIMQSMGWAESPAATLVRAEEAANKALALDDTDVRARVILGRIHINYHRFDQARAELDRAVALNPSDAAAVAGRGSILMWVGQTDAAIEALELALRIDPELNAIDRFTLAIAYYLKGRYDAATEQLRTNLRNADGAHFSRVVLAAAYAQQGRAEDAEAAATAVRRTDPTFEPESFGSKFLNTADLARLREGLRKAGLYPREAATAPAAKPN